MDCNKVNSIQYVNNEITSSIFNKGQFLQSANEMVFHFCLILQYCAIDSFYVSYFQLQLEKYKSFISFYQVHGDHWRLIVSYLLLLTIKMYCLQFFIVYFYSIFTTKISTYSILNLNVTLNCLCQQKRVKYLSKSLLNFF